MTILLLFSFLLSGLSAPASTCDCPENLTRLSLLLRENYAGYTDKVNPKTEAAYNRHLAQFQTLATRQKTPAACEQVLKNYLAFFGDQHLKLYAAAPDTAATVEPEVFPLTPEAIRAQLAQPSRRRHPLEGIWEREGYTVAVIRDPRSPDLTFAGVVLASTNPAWKPGLVKMKLQPASTGGFSVDYRMGDFSRENTEALFHRNVLDIRWIGQFWKREPQADQPLQPAIYFSQYPYEPIEIRWFDEQTVVLKFQSFNPSYKPLIDSTLAAHENRLKQTPNWVLDVRYNGGGGTGTYQSLLPYLYTSPIVRTGSRYWTSPTNIAKYRELGISFFDEVVAFGEKNPNAWFESPGDTVRLAEVLPNPRRVAILASRRTGSAAEILLLHARQSRKVTLFGENTGGVLDYGDGVEHTLPYAPFTVVIPVRRSNYLDYTHYDGIGITPDVRIPSGAWDWYGFVQDYWKQQDRKSVTEQKPAAKTR
ncbi:S41 family peptidase [Tellurirhabdus rosea]|uniref:S41 family peptidase n=1 Tax=Tellurirhabdus rosea TaxID=2674997 RepID=UPI0022598BB8|nr:S41 family peptidase [Tellurirhabdus rosea]